MRSLNEVNDGRNCCVVWLIGRLGSMIRQSTGIDLDDHVRMIRNMGSGGVIISFSGKRYAMDCSAAHAVKVNPV